MHRPEITGGGGGLCQKDRDFKAMSLSSLHAQVSHSWQKPPPSQQTLIGNSFL